MSITFEPVFEDFAARVAGVDLAQTLDEETVVAIDRAMDRFAVLVFPNQPLTAEQQLAFTRQLGPLDTGFSRIGASMPTRLGSRDLADISNVDLSGNVAARDDRRIVSNMANQLWHSDSSFQAPPARYSLLSAVVVPGQGGETEFADMRWAYDRLDAATRAEIAGLVGEHYALQSRLGLGDADWTDEQKAVMPPVRWPLVRRHPGSERDLLFIGAHVSHIVGMTVAEGRILLRDLLEDATERAYVYRHEWTPGDAVMWDNRAVLHRGRRFDVTQRRELRRTTTADVDRARTEAVAA